MELRTEFDKVLKKWGHNVLLQRVEQPYVNTPPSFSDSKLEMHTVRHMYPNSQSLTFAQNENIEGVTYDVDVVYYFRHDVKPTAGDRIYDNIERFPNSYILFTVDWAAPMKGKHGEIVFWTVGCTKQKPN